MAYAVSGLLFYPSLDNQIECVGGSDQFSVGVDGGGEILNSACATNDTVKYAASIIMLVLVTVTILASLWITYKEFEELAMSTQARAPPRLPSNQTPAVCSADNPGLSRRPELLGNFLCSSQT